MLCCIFGHVKLKKNHGKEAFAHVTTTAFLVRIHLDNTCPAVTGRPAVFSSLSRMQARMGSMGPS